MLHRSGAQQHATDRQLQPHRDHRLEQGIVEVGADAADLACRGHLHTQDRVGAVEPREGELRRLDADVVQFEDRSVDLAHRPSHDDPRGEVDEVELEDLRGEGERARGSQVALDDQDVVVLGHELDVERPVDLQFLCDLGCDPFDPARGLDVGALGWQDQRRITGVDPRVLDMFRDRVHEHLALAGHGVQFDLSCRGDELGDHRGVIRRDLGCALQHRVQGGGVFGHGHRGAREHVGRTHQYRVAHPLGELLRRLDRADLDPFRLVDIQFVAQAGELVPVLGPVDAGGSRAQDVQTRLAAAHREIVRCLAAHRDDDALGCFEFADLTHRLEGDLVEIEPVALVVVGADRLGVAVEHQCAAAHLA